MSQLYLNINVIVQPQTTMISVFHQTEGMMVKTIITHMS